MGTKCSQFYKPLRVVAFNLAEGWVNTCPKTSGASSSHGPRAKPLGASSSAMSIFWSPAASERRVSREIVAQEVRFVHEIFALIPDCYRKPLDSQVPSLFECVLGGV